MRGLGLKSFGRGAVTVRRKTEERELYLCHGNYALLCPESNFCNVTFCGFNLGKNLGPCVDEIK